MRLIYITGSGRSGSTILATALGGLESVVNLGEVNFFWSRGVMSDELCGCGRPFGDCAFWQEVVASCEADARATAVNLLQARLDRMRYALPRLVPGIRTLSASAFMRRAELQEYVAHLRDLYDAIAEKAGQGTVLVDSSKSVSYLMNLRELDAVEISVVHIVRDSRSVAMSLRRRRIRTEVSSAVVEMTRMSARASAINWNIANITAGALERLPDIRYVRLRLEDFVADPKMELERLTVDLGIPSDTIEQRFVDDKTLAQDVAHSVSGNPSRFVEGNIALRTDDDWRSELTASEQRTVSILTMPLLRRYGYPL